VQQASTVTERKTPLLLYSVSSLVLALLLFCIVDLVIVSVLSPRGKVLRGYNEEKNALVEENRVLEQRIAERMAIDVISTRAEKELGMKRVESVTFVKTPSVAADASVSQ
jgi:hypothetical protein